MISNSALAPPQSTSQKPSESSKSFRFFKIPQKYLIESTSRAPHEAKWRKWNYFRYSTQDLTFHCSGMLPSNPESSNLAESLQYKSWKRNLRCPTEDSTFRSSVTTEMEINILENRSISREQERERKTFRSSIAASAFPALPPTPWNLPPKWE